MLRYLKAAFGISPELPGLGAVPVNVLAVLGFAILGVANPGFWLVGLAAETLFLVGLASNARFQKYVDAKKAKLTRAMGAATAKTSLDRILASLPAPACKRFEELRGRCDELRQIARELHQNAPDQDSPPDSGSSLDEIQLAGLDRLLWIYLKLLFSESSLDRFMQKTSAQQIGADIRATEERLKTIPTTIDTGQQAKLRKVLEDNLATSKERLANLQKAQGNVQLVKEELSRLENKIRTLSELAVNRQEPDFISGQVDQVAASMVHTERTITDLQFVTGLTAEDEEPPALLRRAVAVK